MTPPYPTETFRPTETFHVPTRWAVFWTVLGAVIVGATFSLTGAHVTTGAIVATFVLWGAALVRHQLGRDASAAPQKSRPKSSRSRV